MFIYEICIDFDGTLVTHEYPRIGKPVPHADVVVKKLRDAGHILILHTMRGIEPGTKKDYLDEAKKYCEDNDLGFTYYNVNPTQFEWTNSPKTYGQIYIDDSALGCPVIHPRDMFGRKYVDWFAVEKMLIEMGVIQ